MPEGIITGLLEGIKKLWRRDTGGKILVLCGAGSLALIFSCCFCCLPLGLMGSLDGSLKTENTSTPVPKENIRMLIADIPSDPEFQEWVEIDARTKHFKKNKDWIKDTFEFLHGANRKWHVVSGDQILIRANKVYGEGGTLAYPSDKMLYEKSEEQMDILRTWFYRKIVQSLLSKREPPLPVLFQDVEHIAVSYGFNQRTEEEVHASIYMREVSWKRSSDEFSLEFSVLVNPEGKVLLLRIPLHTAVIDDYKRLLLDDTEESRIELEAAHRDEVKRHFSHLPAWVEPCLDLTFQSKSDVVLRKAAEISDADAGKLEKMSSGWKPEGDKSGYWSTRMETDDFQVILEYTGKSSKIVVSSIGYGLFILPEDVVP